MMLGILCLLILGILSKESKPGRLSPDGAFYLLPKPPRPYSMRPYMAWGLKKTRDIAEWRQTAILYTCLTALTLSGQSWFAAGLWLGLAMTRTNLWFPVLTDQFGVFLLTVAVCLQPPFAVWWVFLPLAILMGFVNEKSWFFAFLVTLNPWFLAGLPISAFLYWRGPKPQEGVHPAWLVHPLKEALSPTKLAELTDIRHMILPWGVALVGLFHVPLLLLVAAYGQCFFAQDRARLYQWIGPVVCIAAARALPGEWYVPLLLLHLMNPWRSVV